MPVILNRASADLWLAQTPLPQLQPLLTPYPAGDMQAVKVSQKVNSPAIESPDLIIPE
jgi:putative SOS response-associated peptidase YedK